MFVTRVKDAEELIVVELVEAAGRPNGISAPQTRQ